MYIYSFILETTWNLGIHNTYTAVSLKLLVIQVYIYSCILETTWYSGVHIQFYPWNYLISRCIYTVVSLKLLVIQVYIYSCIIETTWYLGVYIQLYPWNYLISRCIYIQLYPWNYLISRCICPAGWGGTHCAEHLDISIPELSGTGFISFPTLQNAYSDLHLSLEFKPTAWTGILYFYSMDRYIVLLQHGQAYCTSTS